MTILYNIYQHPSYLILFNNIVSYLPVSPRKVKSSVKLQLKSIIFCLFQFWFNRAFGTSGQAVDSIISQSTVSQILSSPQSISRRKEIPAMSYVTNNKNKGDDNASTTVRHVLLLTLIKLLKFIH